MLTDFRNSFADRLSCKSVTSLCLNFHHTLNVSLQYLVKYLCSKNRHAEEVIEENCCVEELVSRLRCSTFFQFFIIDTLYRGASIDAAYFFNIPKNILNVILGG